MLSLRVLQTNDEDGTACYYNTLTNTTLPLDSDEATLRANFFLAGQDTDAIVHNLMRDRGLLNLTIIPTWECNLRCTHCSVTTQLKKTDQGEIDTQRLTNFVRRYLDKFNSPYMAMHFVGGEPLLKQAKVREIIESIYEILEGSGITCMASLTTNATIELTSDAYAIFDLLDKINVSVDGNEAQHNTQRRPLHQLDNPYQRTIANLREMVNYGLADKIHVKSAVRDEWYTKDTYRAFLETMAEIGIDLEHVLFGCLHPTDLKHDPTQLKSYQQLFATRPIAAPCCKYRGNSVWLIDSSNELYDLPYKWAQSKLGTLEEDLDVILERRRQIILDTFPCFKDEKCMKCPVIGFCWGQCANSDPLVNGKPSDFCNQDKLIDSVRVLHEAGNLIKHMNTQANTAKIDMHTK